MYLHKFGCYFSSNLTELPVSLFTAIRMKVQSGSLNNNTQFPCLNVRYLVSSSRIRKIYQNSKRYYIAESEVTMVTIYLLAADQTLQPKKAPQGAFIWNVPILCFTIKSVGKLLPLIRQFLLRKVSNQNHRNSQLSK